MGWTINTWVWLTQTGYGFRPVWHKYSQDRKPTNPHDWYLPSVTDPLSR